MTEMHKAHTEAFLKRTAVLGFMSIVLWMITLADFYVYGRVPIVSSIIPVTWFLLMPIVSISNHNYLRVEKSTSFEILNWILMIFHLVLAWLTVSKDGMGNLICFPSFSFIVSILIIIKIIKSKARSFF